MQIELSNSSEVVDSQLSDSALYQLCCEYGAMALHARRKFLGLLPEVARRRLYEQYGFSSELAGVSEEQVRRTLNLDLRFLDKPILRSQLVNGEVSVNKLARVASVATAETAEFWSAQAKTLAKSALETLVRDEKVLQKSLTAVSVPGHSNPQESEQKSMFPGCAVGAALELQLNDENCKRLLELQKKGIDVNGLISEALDARENSIRIEKDVIVNEQNSSVQNNSSRHIPVRVKRVIEKEFGKKCAISHCNMPAVTIHHTARFALSGDHNPYYLAPLCREHHQIAHAIDEKYYNLSAMSFVTSTVRVL